VKAVMMFTNSGFDPFSAEKLDIIFKIDSSNPTRITSRESGHLEFKENFNWTSWQKYGRTLSAFANNQGGYLVFGIGDSPRELIGMTNNKFDSVTPEKISSDLNSAFAPEIKWYSHVHLIGTKRFGIIYTEECLNKPIIATKTIRDGKRVKEGEIYYRYRAKSERIHYSELHALIESRQTQNLSKWLEFIKRVAKIGVENAAMVDLLEGTLAGPGGTLIISEELLNQIKFIREGQFTETDGDPTLRVVGEVESMSTNLIQPIRLVDKRIGINMPDIIHAFLDQEKVNSPREFIKQMCFEQAGYTPIYYYAHLAQMSKPELIEFIDKRQSRYQGKRHLLKRLRGDDNGCVPKSTCDPVWIAKIENETIDPNLNPDDVKQILWAIRTLTRDEVNIDYLFPIIKEWFDTYHIDRSNKNLDSELRRAMCYLDCMFYGSKNSGILTT
jgi:hypothetical protein